MLFENYSYILTNYGYIDIKNLADTLKLRPRIAYIKEDGTLGWAIDYIVKEEIPEVVTTYTSNDYISFATSEDALFYDDNFNKSSFELLPSDVHNAKEVYVSYDSFKDINVDAEKLIDIDFNGHVESISLNNFIKLLLLYYMFSAKNSKIKDNTIRLYASGRDARVLRELLNEIIGKDNYNYFSKDGFTYYIKSDTLYKYFSTNEKKTLTRLLYNDTFNYSSKYVAKATLELASYFNYFDDKFIDHYVLFGVNLDRIRHIITACLNINGYKTKFNRTGFGKYKLMFYYDQKQSFFKDIPIKTMPNFSHKRYFRILLNSKRPIFIQETRNYNTTTSIRQSGIIESKDRII